MTTKHYLTTIAPRQVLGESAPVQFLGWDNNPEKAMAKALERGGISGLIDSVICDACVKDGGDLTAMAECPRCVIFLDLINTLWDFWEANVRQRRLIPETNREATARARSCYEALMGGAEVWYSETPTLCGCKSGKLYVRTVEYGACGVCGAATVADAEAVKAKRRAEAAERQRKSRAARADGGKK